ncbi:hypothetical protein CUJ83_14965 [Methanocella sp. CWC-04]|uniref:Uncharacterized protein n=1 Tax=Methanooceanicella nereidis TaxID=2052831 RepID=A0AAP2RFT6_9EURY|nr:hypothetical protein [Methanocella sp. CWC-04]MCD1296302.1 hypothetical protein [Methanocella sp. CWC-04]
MHIVRLKVTGRVPGDGEYWLLTKCYPEMIGFPQENCAFMFRNDCAGFEVVYSRLSFDKAFDLEKLLKNAYQGEALIVMR